MARIVLPSENETTPSKYFISFLTFFKGVICSSLYFNTATQQRAGKFRFQSFYFKKAPNLRRQ